MNAKQRQERNERILENAGTLEQIRDIARKVLGDSVDAAMVHLICQNMRVNDEMDVSLLEDDLKNAAGLSEQLFGVEDGSKIESILGVYEDCTAKPFEDDDED